MLNELNTYTLQELYKQPIEPIPWVVEDLLAPGLYFLGGSPKVGKSWLALQLCLAVCQGEPFLGFHAQKSEVLYLALEDGPRRLHARTLHLTEEAPAGLHLCGHAPMIGQGLEQQLDRAAKRYKASTLAGYRKMLEVAYPYIGGLPLCKIRPMVLEEFAEELRKRPGRGGKPLSENTVHKYLDAVSAVLQDAAKNDILLYNPAHRVERVRVEKVQQRIPQQWEMRKLLQCLLQEPLLYRVFYLMALSTGLRRGELCALRWCDLHGGNQVKIQHSRSTVVGQGVLESDTKNHRTRIVVMPQIVFDDLGELFTEQALENNGADWNGLIFQRKGKPIHPDSFSRHLRQLYDRNGFPEEYHLHTMRHFFATYLLEHGTSKQVAADLLGHADTAFLERTYCHPQDVCKEEAAGLFDSLLAPAEEEYCAALDE